jgi:hypothetical protein
LCTSPGSICTSGRRAGRISRTPQPTAPDEALPEIVLFIGQMLVGRGFQLDEPVSAEGADVDVLRSFLAARKVAQLADAEPEDVNKALEDLREIYAYLVTDRAPPYAARTLATTGVYGWTLAVLSPDLASRGHKPSARLEGLRLHD